MDLLQLIKIALRGIRDNKLRSFLTMLGIIIGVASVITLVSLGQGATAKVKEQIQSLGSNLLTIMITGRGATTTMTYEQAMELKNSPLISGVAPVINDNTTVKYGNKTADVQVIGTNADYTAVRSTKVSQGRFIVEDDLVNRRAVAVIGSQVVEDLFGFLDPVGQEIKLEGRVFTVVGVLASKGNTMAGSEDNQIMIPVTLAERITRTRGVRTIYLQAAGAEQVEQALAYVTSELGKLFKGDQEDDEDSFRVFDQTQMLNTVNQTTGVLTMMLGGIAGISLLVGGIGIMNIMLVSVTERTREIGIRKALGAKKRDILTQFLIESLVISSIGGFIGIFFGLLLGQMLQYTMNLTVSTTLSVIWIAFGFSLLIGVFFGIWPANKAANLKPIEALRYE